jgi:hypothetical protein
MSERAFSQSTVTDAGRQRESRAVHSENAPHSMTSNSDSETNVTELKLEHPQKLFVFNIRTILGIVIDFRHAQFSNADEPICERSEPASNVNAASDQQSEKHSLPKIVTDAGIDKDCSDEHE